MAYLSNGQWEVFNTENSGLPNDNVVALVEDNEKGLWIGTNGGGLAHLNQQREWKVFKTENSSLPNDSVTVLVNEGSNGLWVGTFGGGLAQVGEDILCTAINPRFSVQYLPGF